MRYLLLVVLALGAGAALAQQMYRWTDKDGKIHYGNNPPAGVAATVVKDKTNVAVPQASTQSGGPKHNAHALGRDDPNRKPRIDPKKQY